MKKNNLSSDNGDIQQHFHCTSEHIFMMEEIKKRIFTKNKSEVLRRAIVTLYEKLMSEGTGGTKQLPSDDHKSRLVLRGSIVRNKKSRENAAS